MAIKNRTMERLPDRRSKPNNLHQQIPYLVPEIITQILSRLPVKSLLQFRSVSKSWCSLISDPKFVKTHLNISSKNHGNTHHRLIFVSVRHGKKINIEKCNLSHVLNLASVNLTELDYPMKHPDMRLPVYVVGSVNGLICIAIGFFTIGEHDTFLWNPTTRISKKIPQSGFKLRPEGFGYDESNDDYKIVGFSCAYGTKPLEVIVYSLRADCWRRIDDFPRIPNGFIGKFLKGAIHWVAYLNNGSTLLPNPRSIVTLDLANETYSELPQPNYRDGEFASLVVQGESLFLVTCYHQCQKDVWMMKEYGVRESWTKLASFPYSDGPTEYELPDLLYLSKEGEMLLAFSLHVLLFDLKSNSFRNIDNPNFGSPLLGATTYIESLVSPAVQEGHERHQ